VRDDVIVLQTMMWPDEVRQPDLNTGSPEDAKPQEVKMAHMLVETLAGDFDADEYEDDYRAAVEALVRAKIEGGEVEKAPAAAKSSGEVVDLLAALQRSVDAAKSARGEATGEATGAQVREEAAGVEEASASGGGTKGTARKTAQKATAKKGSKKSATAKAPAKKSTTKKSTTKKASAQKATAQKTTAKKTSRKAS
ncbi:MAG TPA: hypothetical protein VFM09_03915, partial [Marmoricola sp.]|nr:hypothetical protein [Marmoricola sp.]